MSDIFDTYADGEWVYAVVGLSNLLGRLDVLRASPLGGRPNADMAADTWHDSPHLQDLWHEAEAALQFEDFLGWFGSVGNSAIVDGVKEDRRGKPRRTRQAETLVSVMRGLVEQEERIDECDLGELSGPDVERLIRSLRGIDRAVADMPSVWDELIDRSELHGLLDDLLLDVNVSDTDSETFREIVTPDILRQIKAGNPEPLQSTLTRLIRTDYRHKLAAALGCGVEHLLTRLVLTARARKRLRNSDDLFAAERTRIRITDLIRAASHGVLTVLQQAQQQDADDDGTSVALAAGLLCIRRNYRQAVKALTGLEDTYDVFSAAHADSLLETLRTEFKHFLEHIGRNTDVATEPLTRQIALLLEVIDFYPFEADVLDVSSQALRDPNRYQLLLPLSDPNTPSREPISRAEFDSRLAANLTADGAELVRV